MKNKKSIIVTIVVAIILIISVTLVIFLHAIPAHNRRKQIELANKLHMQYTAEKLAKYAQENELYADYEIDIAFLGDSLTDGYDVENFYPQYKVVNRGIGGDRTYNLKDRISVSAYDLKPKVVVMLIGANNFKTMFDDYEDIVQGLKTNLPDTKIVLLSLTAMSGELWGKNNSIACLNNVKIELIAEKYGCTFVDLFTPLFDLHTNGLYSEFTTDGGHLNQAGYVKVTSILTPVLENLL